MEMKFRMEEDNCSESWIVIFGALAYLFWLNHKYQYKEFITTISLGNFYDQQV